MVCLFTQSTSSCRPFSSACTSRNFMPQQSSPPHTTQSAKQCVDIKSDYSVTQLHQHWRLLTTAQHHQFCNTWLCGAAVFLQAHITASSHGRKKLPHKVGRKQTLKPCLFLGARLLQNKKNVLISKTVSSSSQPRHIPTPTHNHIYTLLSVKGSHKLGCPVSPACV